MAGLTGVALGEGKTLDVPSDDIFGFTSPTGIGKPGDQFFVNENSGGLGKRQGAYMALDMKYGFGRTLSESWWVAGAAFGAYNYAHNVPGVDDIHAVAFEGLSFESEYRLIKRTATNPFAISISVEPGWLRIDQNGKQANSLLAAFKIFIDAVLVPDKFFWAANAIWVPQIAQDPTGMQGWIGSSSTLLSNAVTYQANANLFFGVEGRLLSAFDGVRPAHNLGNAFYLGPTMLWKITDKIAFNTTYQPQIAGHAVGSPYQRLDLDNFSRAQFRVKLAVSY